MLFQLFRARPNRGRSPHLTQLHESRCEWQPPFWDWLPSFLDVGLGIHQIVLLRTAWMPGWSTHKRPEMCLGGRWRKGLPQTMVVYGGVRDHTLARGEVDVVGSQRVCVGGCEIPIVFSLHECKMHHRWVGANTKSANFVSTHDTTSIAIPCLAPLLGARHDHGLSRRGWHVSGLGPRTRHDGT